MKTKFFSLAAIGIALWLGALASVAGAAAVPDVPGNAAMPVLYQAVKGGPTYPVLAKQGDQFYQVFVYDKGQPYFTDREGKWHFASGTNGEGAYALYYASGETSQPTAVPRGKTDEQAHAALLTGGGEANVNLVCWGGYGWYGYDYAYYNSYSYYPGYYYGGGYGGYGYNNYYPNYYGYYGYGSPYSYSGYGCVINNGYYW